MLTTQISFTLLQTYKVLKQTQLEIRQQMCFTLLQTYKVLKHSSNHKSHEICFTLLQTYKVLKLIIKHPGQYLCFTLLQTYKVLKLVKAIKFLKLVLHSYKLTRFSNSSDTLMTICLFYTLTNLQGSQTSNEIITEPKHTGNMCKPFSNV